MFGVGGPELIVIVVVALIFVGPDKLPKVARSVGSGLRDLRRAANAAQAEFKETVDDLIREADLDAAIQLDDGGSSARNRDKESSNQAETLIRRHPDSGFHFDDDEQGDEEMAVDGQECEQSEDGEQPTNPAPDFAEMLHSEQGQSAQSNATPPAPNAAPDSFDPETAP